MAVLKKKFGKENEKYMKTEPPYLYNKKLESLCLAMY